MRGEPASAKVTHHRVLCLRAMLRWSLWSEYMGVDSSFRQTPVGESEKIPVYLCRCCGRVRFRLRSGNSSLINRVMARIWV